MAPDALLRMSLNKASSSPVRQLWREIEKLAHEDLRSINGEIEFFLKRAVEERRGKGKGNSE
jgi:hypothetical protein